MGIFTYMVTCPSSSPKRRIGHLSSMTPGHSVSVEPWIPIEIGRWIGGFLKALALSSQTGVSGYTPRILRLFQHTFGTHP